VNIVAGRTFSRQRNVWPDIEDDIDTFLEKVQIDSKPPSFLTVRYTEGEGLEGMGYFMIFATGRADMR